MYIKKVKEMPTEGQFVITWIWEGVVWSGTYAWIQGILYDLTFDEPASDDVLEWAQDETKDYFIAQEYKNASTRS